ncbi:MAG TPA: ABC transporter ATP-binding protein [Solirubrobacteraceae bacterium]|nr:ABC transporter ATP-binding protein [Solirubrobacteraceae bacterium]
MELSANITLPRRAFDLRIGLRLSEETLALVGPSGAGKTSLLRAIAGLERPTEGRIALDDEIWLDAGRGVDLRPERRRVGYLPQDYALFPHLTVSGNVRFAGRRDRPDLLAKVGIEHLAGVRPGELSGGERQRVALARALAREPRVLLLDEPFAALDAITREQVRSELEDVLPGLRLPTLIVTHSFEDAAALGDRVGVLAEGRILQLATPAELMREPAHALVAQLSGANTLAGIAQPDGSGSLVRLDGGGELRSSAPASGRVQVAIQPWAVELTDAHGSSLTDTVLSVHPERGGLVVRLGRLTARIKAGENGGTPVEEGTLVGVRVAPGDVRVLAP